ncbi:hypothetical protein [Paenibacillus sp. FSL R5-0519]
MEATQPAGDYTLAIASDTVWQVAAADDHHWRTYSIVLRLSIVACYT